MTTRYAHSSNDQGERHDLVEHLNGVAELAAFFGSEFHAEDAAYFLGLWHDLGKFNPAFQRYLLESEANPTGRGHGPEHKLAGTILAKQYLGLGALLAHGHHGGLREPTYMEGFLADAGLESAARQALELARLAIPHLEPKGQGISLPEFMRRDGLAAEFFFRFLFSALVDADSLDTEAHFSREKTVQRGNYVNFAELWEQFARNQEEILRRPATPVNDARKAIYEACLAAAEEPPGIYRLNVPTGGGKTLSSMAFALMHGLRHGQRRIIVAVPFISITEQTASIYRDIFQVGDTDNPAVLENHSGAMLDDVEDFHRDHVWARLAAENWDAPIIVTTTVQLFESLFANGRSKTRKLHRLANSVIILDEAQALPHHLLEPILDAIQQLCNNYNTTVVLSTATQPAFEAIPSIVSLQAREIVPAPGRFFDALRRVNYEWRLENSMSWAEVAGLMQGEPQALVVVNTKKDAMNCLQALDDPKVLHLSTLLCGAHRRQVLQRVRQHLKQREPCRLVSTQVVEAGVDLDFPLVLRALAPLDSIIQAAGRCNREGVVDKGRVIVFHPEEGGLPRGTYTIGANITRALLSRRQDLDNPEMSREYFRDLLQTLGTGTDREQIQDLRRSFDYPEVARRFRMIDDNTVSVVITNYGTPDEQAKAQGLVGQLREGSPNARFLLRQLQPYIVSVYQGQFAGLERGGLVSSIAPDLWEWRGDYHPVCGIGGVTSLDPDRLIF